MTEATDLTRRAALAFGGVGAVGSALALAGCAPTAGSSSDGGSAGSGSGQAPASDVAGQDVAALADIPVGGSIDATIGGEPVLISQPTAGTVVAFSAICTHQGCVVAAAGSQFECPCHGSVFDAATGAVEQGPAPSPLPQVAVTVDGDRVIAG